MANNKIKYNGFEIVEDRLLGYSLYKDNVWCCSDSTIDDLKKTVDSILSNNHLNWEIKYFDADNNTLYALTINDCSIAKAEKFAVKNKTKEAVNYSILEI